jgi:hypothetical protein
MSSPFSRWGRTSDGEIKLLEDMAFAERVRLEKSLDLTGEAEPPTPAANVLRLYHEVIRGFSFFKYLDSTGMKRQLIRDSMILVKNIRGLLIAANRIVYATGSEDQVPTIDLAQANSAATMPAIGVTVEAIADGAFGRVMQVGLLENVNTAALAEGDILYVSPATPGVPVTAPPTAPNLVQEIGTVLVSDAAAGAIQIIARGVIVPYLDAEAILTVQVFS